MARLDIECDTCELVIRDIDISGDKIGEGGKIKVKCPDCKNTTFHTWWGGGEAPGIATIGDDKARILDDCKTVGEFWDKTGVNLASESYKVASRKRIKAMRDKAMKNDKNNGS